MAAFESGLGSGCAQLLSSWESAIRTSTDWRRFLIALISGVLSVLSLAPFFFWPVLFITIAHLVWLIDGVDRELQPKQAFWSAALVGWLFGFGYFSAGLFWVGEAFLVQADQFLWALPFAVTLLPAGLALFFAAAAGLARLYWVAGLSRILVLAVTLTIAEWLRGHVLTGFPWNTLGYALTYPLPLMQMAALISVYGLTLWTVTLTAVPVVMALDAIKQGQSVGRAALGTICVVVVLALFWIYGAQRLAVSPLSYIDGVKMRVVQVSVPQREKWVRTNQERIFSDHLKLSKQNGAGDEDGLEGITHVIWPEVAMPFLPLEVPVVAKRIGEMLPEGTHLLTGALRRDPLSTEPATSNGVRTHTSSTSLRKRGAYNSMLVYNAAGQAVMIYDKIHLVPFGEYLPFQDTLEAIGLRQLSRMRGGFTSGGEPRPLLNVGLLNGIAGLICYEAIFPGEVSAGANPEDRPQIYINMTNDGWFGNTTGPRQHFQQARVRAVETGIPILRAANNGISAMIGPAGRVPHRLTLNQKGTLDSFVPKRLAEPVYARFGDWTLCLQLALFLVYSILLAVQRERAT